jgi:hypothetical protein
MRECAQLDHRADPPRNGRRSLKRTSLHYLSQDIPLARHAARAAECRAWSSVDARVRAPRRGSGVRFPPGAPHLSRWQAILQSASRLRRSRPGPVPHAARALAATGPGAAGPLLSGWSPATGPVACGRARPVQVGPGAAWAERAGPRVAPEIPARRRSRLSQRSLATEARALGGVFTVSPHQPSRAAARCSFTVGTDWPPSQCTMELRQENHR